jgi:hypothetical protein
MGDCFAQRDGARARDQVGDDALVVPATGARFLCRERSYPEVRLLVTAGPGALGLRRRQAVQGRVVVAGPDGRRGRGPD